MEDPTAAAHANSYALPDSAMMTEPGHQPTSGDNVPGLEQSTSSTMTVDVADDGPSSPQQASSIVNRQNDASANFEDADISIADELRDLISPSPAGHVPQKAIENVAPAAADVQMNDISSASAMDTAVAETTETVPRDEAGNGEAEWEIDSSPYESSDSSSSDDSTSDDSEEDEDDQEYSMLSPLEQARILMQDGGSDDEGPSKASKGTGGHVRSVNEKQEEVVPKPAIEVTPEMSIEELGEVVAAVEGTVLVKAKISGEYRVLESGSLLCLKDRSVVGVVAETLGRVQEPLYTVRFTNDEAIKEAGLAQTGTPIYYVQQHSTYVFTQPLKSLKGSDASNVNDEEVGDDEMEFSDDEAEAEYKRLQKQKRQEKRDNRSGASGPTKAKVPGPYRGNEHSESMYDDTPEINYDDVETKDDEGYTPLARPSNLHEMMGKKEAPSEGRSNHFGGHSRGRGDGHHRGGRGRGRGDRGRGRGGRNDYNARVHEQRGFPNAGFSHNGQSSGHSWPQQSYSHPPSGYPPNLPMAPIHGQPGPIPQSPGLPPQASQYPTFSPSPISPLPPTSQFQWPPSAQPNRSNFPMPPPPPPPPPAFYNQGQPQYGQQPANGQGRDNGAALAQVQAQLQMLQQYASSYQQNGNGG